MNSAVWYASWLTECLRITSHRMGAAWVFNSWRSFPVLARASYMADWPIRSLLVWNKDTLGLGGTEGLRPSYELIALFAANGFAIEDRTISDVWTQPYATARPNHPAEKPVPLLRRLLSVSGAGSTLDPFMGSGSTLVAAKSLGRQAIGVEIEERYCEIAANRCRQEVLGLAG